jgi:hypothetical protein
MSDDLKERLKDMSVLSQSRTPADALKYIEELEADLRKMALDCLAADGQSQEAYQAQLAAEAKLAMAVEALKFYAYVDDDQGIRARKILEEMGEK